MFSSKKGMALQEVGKLLLLLIGAIVLIFILIYFFAPNLMDDFWPCRLNVLFRTKIFGVGITSPLDLRMCKTHHNELSEKTEDEISKILADRMSNCAGKYWNGKVDFFSDWDFGKSNYRCMICNIDRFKNFEGEIDIKKIEGMINKEDHLGKKVSFGDISDKLKISNSVPVYTVFAVHKINEGFLKNAFEGEVVGLVATFGGGLVGCVSVGAIGIAIGAGVGAIPGCIVGAKLGLGIGSGVGIVTNVVYVAAHKSVFIPEVYLINSQIGETCTSLE